jgi:crossover junction endodeoxyribonuclease RuvC
MTSAPRVVGVDPSMTATGIATADGCETITSKSLGKSATGVDELRRLQRIVVQTVDACRDADLVVIEVPAFSSVTGKSTDRAGLHWLIRDRLDVERIPVALVITSSLKKYATGKGNAGKDEVLIAVVQRLPIHVANNNEADAATLLAMGLDKLGHPLATMPAIHRSSLAAVRWPEGILS